MSPTQGIYIPDYRKRWKNVNGKTSHNKTFICPFPNSRKGNGGIIWFRLIPDKIGKMAKTLTENSVGV